jgi:hypothetical protein
LVLNPESFVPERWETLQRRDSDHFLAFGGGKKGCAGKQFALLMLLPLARHRGTDICITFIWKISSVNYLLGEVRV